MAARSRCWASIPHATHTSCKIELESSCSRHSCRNGSKSGKRWTFGPRFIAGRPVTAKVCSTQLGLAEKRNAWFMTLSGGQKQRLFIALALVNDPEVVFLDELTTGLDPQARHAIWDLVRGIRERGKTVFLTTHLMEEAERLCDRVAIIEHGRIVDIDKPRDLVNRHCPERSVILATDDPNAAERFRRIAKVDTVACSGAEITIRGRGDDLVTEVIRCLSENRIHVTDFRTLLPNLEDVFLKLTGRSIRD